MSGSVAAGERHLALERGRNFRDFGGYETADGRRVRWRRLYRSGHLADLTDADYTRLRDTGIRLVCDFRRAEEQERNPTTWHATPRPEILKLPLLDGQQSFEGPGVGERIRSEPAVAREGMIAIYERLVSADAIVASYGHMFERIARSKGHAVLIHCSGGKDRTGVGAALILTALGVDRDTVIEDYLLTNKVVDIEARLDGSERLLEHVGDQTVAWSRESMRQILQANPGYIQAAFATVERNFGTVTDFLRNRLGVDDEVREALHDALLEG